MASIKISALPTFSGNTTGSFFVMDDSDLATTYKVTRESLFTGSLYGTSSWAVTSSYSNYANNANLLDGINSTQFARLDQGNIFLGDQTIVGDLSAVNGTITGTLTAKNILVQTITSSREYITGSTIFGSEIDLNTHQFTGSVTITGSLSSNTRATLPNLTGSLFGTSSWALNSIYSQTSSYSTTLGASLGTLSNDKVRLISSDGSILSTVTVAAVTSSITSSYSTALGASLTAPSNDQVRLLASDGGTLSTVKINAVTSSISASYSTTLGASLNTLSGDKVRLISSDGSVLSTTTVTSVTSSLTSSYSTTLGASLGTLSLDKVRLISSDGTVLSTATVSAVTSSLTSSYSTTLGSSLSAPSNDQVRLLSSNGSTLSTVTVLAVTSSITSSYSTALGASLTAPSNDQVRLVSSNGSSLSTVTVLGVTSSFTASSADSGFFVRGNTTLGNSISNTQKITGSVLVTGSIVVNNPSAGATGESIIAARRFKIDGGATGETAKMYVISETLSDTYGSGMQIQFANQADTYGFGFNLNTKGGYEIYTKNQAAWGNRMTISGSGVAIGGGTSPSYALDVTGTIRATGDVIAYSDARIKDNVETLEDSLQKVISLRGVSYVRKDIEDKSRKIGVIAQEVLKVLPEVVSKDENGNYSVAYGNIVGLLIEAIKEQQKQIDELKNSLLNK